MEVERDFFVKLRNQILTIVITAACGSLGVNVVFISSINGRLEDQTKRIDKVEIKTDRNFELIIKKGHE